MASWISASLLLAVAIPGAYAEWRAQQSGTDASLRGISAVNSRIAWASGSKGTVLHTIDTGAHWILSRVPGAEELDFRDVEATDATHVTLLSSGAGATSRVYRTSDSGTHWTLQLTNPDPTGFFDAIAFFNPRSGILLGDPVDGHFVIYTAADGQNWSRRAGPAALPGEGAFAASGTCLVARGNGEAWFGTGAGRVFHSTDSGLTWMVAQTPLRHEGKAAGVFSIAFHDRLHGTAVGGNYSKPAEKSGNLAMTEDGGITWHEPLSRPGGYRSAVAYTSRRQVIATGTNGSDISSDRGNTWRLFDGTGYNALSFRGKTGWAVGPQGRIALWR